MPYNLRVILGPEVQSIFDNFSACFNIRIQFFDYTGQILSVGQNRPEEVYCRLVQRQLYGKQACTDQVHTACAKAINTRSLVCYKCHAGLAEAIIPIFHNDQLLGKVFIGQFRSIEKIPAKVLADAEERGLGSSLQVAFDELPYVPQERMDHILGILSTLVGYIITQRMVSFELDSVVQQLVNLLDENIASSLTLQDAAEAVGKSPSSVSHLFRKQFGQSFKQAFLSFKLAHADVLLKTQSEMTIKQIAEAVGYDDPLYFSRLYKKYRGITPSAIRTEEAPIL